jgi:hypothetical protein
MANGLTRDQLLRLARLGAVKRLEELRAEVRAIEALIGKGNAAAAPGGRRGPRKRRRPKWSAAQRKAAADRMRAYWASRKAKRK